MNDAMTLFQQVRRARDTGRYDEALGYLNELPDELRSEFDVLAQEADLYCRLGDHDRELALYDRLIDGWPDAESVWLARANALKIVGRTDEAIESARRAIAIRPTYGKAWWVLSDLKTFEFSDDDVSEMQRVLDSAGQQEDELHLHFAIGKALHDRGDPPAAFRHYAQANALRMRSMPAGSMSVTGRVDQAIELFTPEFLKARAGKGHPSNAPIFIVGLPRAGTTLLEQILASHPQVEGVGELGVLPQLRSDIAADPSFAGEGLVAKITALDGTQLAELGQAYVERAAAFRSTKKAKFVDKLPINWLNIGLIHLILPNAAIIDARRHPMATGFSNFRQNYGVGAGWSYSLEHIGQYYRDYLRLMRHFDRVLPAKVHHVIHERLIDDFEPEVRRLLDQVGLGFDPACLEFHRSDRPVRSASSEQVRRPINREGVDQWRPYEQWLGPLKEALGPELEDWQG